MRVDNIKSTEIFSSYRFDGSYHLSDAILFEKKIKKGNYEVLGNLTDEIFTAGRSKRIYTSEREGIPYLSNSDVVAQNPFECCKYVSKKFSSDENSMLKEGMIVTGRVGAIGQTAYISKEYEKRNAMGSDNIIRIVAGSNVPSGYLYAFLVSKYGNTFFWKISSGGVQPYISEPALCDIPVPLISQFKQGEIHKQINESFELRDYSNKLLEKAEQRLFSLLNITPDLLNRFSSPFEETVGSSFNINISDVSPLSLRARNYSRRLYEIKEFLSNREYSKLKEVIEKPLGRGGRFKRIEVSPLSKNAVELLNQADIFDYKPRGRVISKKTINNWHEELTKKHTILIPALGTLGENEIFSRAKYVWGYLENKTVAEGLMRVTPDLRKIDSGFLFLVLSSKLWFRILRSLVYGTNLLGYIYPFVEEMPIPRFNNEIELELGGYIKDAYNSFTIALEMENKAVGFIEKEIESWQN